MTDPRQTLTIPMPREADLGPKMRALNPQQRRFVVAWFFHSGNASRAAVSAGYTNPDISVAGYQAFHSPKVQAAIHEYAEMIIKTEHLALAMGAITEMLADRGLEPAVRANLAKHVQAQSGFGPKIEKTLSVEVHNRADEIKLLIEFARQTGQDPRKVLGEAADVTDADFEELEKLEPPSAGSTAGLEDLL